MRSFIVMGMFIVSFAQAGPRDYQEDRDLSVNSGNITQFSIDAGAGSLDITGVEGYDRIVVNATIVVSNTDKDKALRLIEHDMTLSLDAKGGEAHLKSWFDRGLLGMGPDAYIALQITVPKGLAITIDDGEGSIDVNNVEGDIVIDDGSGSIDIRNALRVEIDDGSGSIEVERTDGDVTIVDGSGSISVRAVGGSVSIDDGSGSIAVTDVERDLVIIDDGSGGLRYADIRGKVDAET